MAKKTSRWPSFPKNFEKEAERGLTMWQIDTLHIIVGFLEIAKTLAGVLCSIRTRPLRLHYK